MNLGMLCLMNEVILDHFDFEIGGWRWGRRRSFLEGMRISNTLMLDKYFTTSCQIVAFYKPDEIFVRFFSEEYCFCDYFILPANLFEEVLIRNGYVIEILELRNMRGIPIQEEIVDWIKEGF